MKLIECPHHPGQKLLAYQQTAFATPCTIEWDDGNIEIEIDDRTEFIRDMETTTVVCYLCSVDGCGWTLLPEQLHAWLPLPDDDGAHDDDTWKAAQWELPEREPGEDKVAYNARKARFMAERLAERRAKRDSAEKESPLAKFGRVFGGS